MLARRPVVRGTMEVELYDSGPPDPNYENYVSFPPQKNYLEMNDKERCRFHHDMVMRNMVGKLTRLVDRTGFEIIQVNGQRRFAPPLSYNGPKPPKSGAEIFVGKLPKSVFEHEIIELFETVGRIYELRLMMEFNGYNRGYCFITYFDKKHADEAIKKFDQFEIRRGRHIGVVKSMNNCRLFFGGIPKDKTPEEINAEIRKLTIGVTEVIVQKPFSRADKNRGYVFVEYQSHRIAAQARRIMHPGILLMFNVKPHVDWADMSPESEYYK